MFQRGWTRRCALQRPCFARPISLLAPHSCAASAQDLAWLTWALAVLRFRPEEPWLADLLAGWAARTAAGAPPDAQALSMAVWALWSLDVAPPGEWLDAQLELAAGVGPNATAAAGLRGARGVGAQRLFPGATCQSLALLAHCTARMGHTPPPGVRASLLEAAVPLLQRGSAQVGWAGLGA
jgi:hypothetical protein